MPIKRRKDKQRKFQISDEAVELFSHASALQLSPGYDVWEDAGGCRREYLDTWKALHKALHLALCEASPLDVREDDTRRVGGQCWLESVPKVLAIRAELIAATDNTSR
ncbi:hypothetical protein [Bradyrhizobium monzae]|uniref:hypothetical protein n=1 Tax=Bradyrhizobium sp. Oc8 TaxID=2876780 RepID=UPI001F2B1BB4|nr:hypothetical protein [Bradyrhizobium sp. Oc8]